jgi:alanine racemase
MSKSGASLATARLTIDLSALQSNWRHLAAVGGPAESAAVIKADGYGLGAEPIAKALWQAGARTFFTVYPQEALDLRKVLAKARIFTLAGLDAHSALPCRKAGIMPVINSDQELEAWRAEARKAGMRLACALHFDTGMNRLGFDPQDAARLSQDRENLEYVLVMSHLACGEDRQHPMNARQLVRFAEIARHFAGVRLSLANSAGAFLGEGHQFDILRPGIALYGGEPIAGEPNPMRTVASFHARILQVREAKKGETVGYSATQTLTRDSRIAVAGAGYADGIKRGGSGRAGGGASGWIGGCRVPILGRISMDLTAFDVTDVPRQALDNGDWIEFFGPNMPLDEFARACGTISYDVLTGMGRRAERVWTWR